MSTDRRIKTLKTRQKILLASFNLIKTFVDTYAEDSGAYEIPVRLESLDALWSDLKLVQTELESLDEASIDQQLKQRSDFETAYYRVKGFLLSHNKTPSSPRMNTSTNLSSQFSASSSHVRLPDVKLPIFSGNLDDWLNFHDLFVSLVHSLVELSNIQKFYYLRSSLAGDALKLVQTIPLSSSNYPIAWNLLVDHFQNTARLKQSYLDALFEFSSLKRESAADLHSLVEKFEANVKVLKQLGEKTEYWSIILIRMLSSHLDPTTRRDWEEYSSTKDAIAFTDLTSFIQRRVTVLQTIQGKSAESPAFTQQFKKPAQRPVASNGVIEFNAGRKCVTCSDHHPLYMCSLFAKLNLDEKEREVRRHQLCRNCLRNGHHARDCSSSSSCRNCRGRHHSLLCSGENIVAVNSRTSNSSQSETPTASTSGDQSKASVSASIREPISYASTGQHNVLLATAVVKLVDDNGTAHLARALLDSGSECCFITESFSQLVKAQRINISIPISGIGQSSSHARYKIVSTIISRVSDYSTSAEFLVLPKVTIDLPTASIDTSSWQIPPGVHLADPSFHDAKQIDIVIGAEIFFELFKVPGRIPLGNSLPTLVNSVFGWIVSGKVSNGTPTKPVVSNVALVVNQHQFTEPVCIAEDVATPSSSVEPASCEEHFRRTHNTVQRTIARLPLRDADGSDAFEEAEPRRTTVSLASAESSSIDLHIGRFTDYDRTLRTSIAKLATAFVTLERSRFVSSKLLLCWFHPFLHQLIHVGGQLGQPPDAFDCEHHNTLSASLARSSFDVSHLHVVPQLLVTLRHEIASCFTGASNLAQLARVTVSETITFVSTHQKRLKQYTIKLPTCDIDTRQLFGTSINHWRSILLHCLHHRAPSWNVYITFVLWFSSYTSHIELIAYLRKFIVLQPLRRINSNRELHSNHCRTFINCHNELPNIFRLKGYLTNIQGECGKTRFLWHPLKVSEMVKHCKVVIRSAQEYFVHALGYQILPQNDEETRLTQIEDYSNTFFVFQHSDEFLMQKLSKLPSMKWYKVPIRHQQNQLLFLPEQNALPVASQIKIVNFLPELGGTIWVGFADTPTTSVVQIWKAACCRFFLRKSMSATIIHQQSAQSSHMSSRFIIKTACHRSSSLKVNSISLRIEYTQYLH